MAKRQLAWRGNRKYAMHGPNETIRPIALRDQSPVYEFMRCNPHWGGVDSCDQGRYIGKVLTDDLLNNLIERGGTCILYTHLGKIDDPRIPFDKDAVIAFHRLAEAFRDGGILVTTTRRLLGYRRAVREIGWTSTADADHNHIAIETQSDDNISRRLSKADLAGLTLYVPEPKKIRLTIDGQKVKDVKRNASDHTGRPSISLSWPTLEFPKI